MKSKSTSLLYEAEPGHLYSTTRTERTRLFLKMSEEKLIEVGPGEWRDIDEQETYFLAPDQDSTVTVKMKGVTASITPQWMSAVACSAKLGSLEVQHYDG